MLGVPDIRYFSSYKEDDGNSTPSRGIQLLINFFVFHLFYNEHCLSVVPVFQKKALLSWVF